MKKVIAFLLKERGINWLIAVKSQQKWRSDGYFSTYDSIRLSLHYKMDARKIMHDLDWSLNNIKDFAQYQ